MTEQSVAFLQPFQWCAGVADNKLIGAFEMFWDTIVWALMPI